MLRKNLIPLENADNVNVKTFGWTVFHGTALPERRPGKGRALPHPALPRPELLGNKQNWPDTEELLAKKLLLSYGKVKGNFLPI